MPVLTDNCRILPDSDAIRAHLEGQHSFDFDEGLDDQQKAVSRVVIRMVEEHLYFSTVRNRWLNDENWADVKKVLFAKIPKIVNGLVTGRICAGVCKAMKSRGMGRHSVEEQFIRANEDITAIQTLLAD